MFPLDRLSSFSEGNSGTIAGGMSITDGMGTSVIGSGEACCCPEGDVFEVEIGLEERSTDKTEVDDDKNCALISLVDNIGESKLDGKDI